MTRPRVRRQGLFPVRTDNSVLKMEPEGSYETYVAAKLFVENVTCRKHSWNYEIRVFHHPDDVGSRPSVVLSSQHSCFVFGRSRVQISARKQAILTGVFVVFLNSSRQVREYDLKLWRRPLPSTSFPTHHSLITPSFDVNSRELLKKRC
jgi:hypothetical protein